MIWTHASKLKVISKIMTYWKQVGPFFQPHILPHHFVRFLHLVELILYLVRLHQQSFELPLHLHFVHLHSVESLLHLHFVVQLLLL